MKLDLLSALIGMILPFITILSEFALKRLNIINVRKNHISRTKFDKEFQIYQELSEKNLNAVYCVGEATIMVLHNLNFNQSEKEELLEDFCEKMNDAEFSNKKYAPFIDKKIFDSYKKLEKDISFCYTLFKFWIKHNSDTLKYMDKEYRLNEVSEILEKRQKEISNMSDKILDDIREYLDSLDVIS